VKISDSEMNKCRNKRATFMIADLLSAPPEVSSSDCATGSDAVVGDVIDRFVQSPAAATRGRIHRGAEATNQRRGFGEAAAPSARDALLSAADASRPGRCSLPILRQRETTSSGCYQLSAASAAAAEPQSQSPQQAADATAAGHYVTALHWRIIQHALGTSETHE